MSGYPNTKSAVALGKGDTDFVRWLLEIAIAGLGVSRSHWANYRIIPQKVESLQIHTPNYIFIPLHQNKGYESVKPDSGGV